MARNYVQESGDIAQKKYFYDFDERLLHYSMRTFAPLLPSGKALELGCYKGASTELLLKSYSDLTVIEGAENLITETKARVGKRPHFIHSTFEEVQLKDCYDAIFLMHTLEHLDHPVAILKRVRGWLAGGGRLFLTVPNAHAPSRQIAVKMGLISHNSAVTDAEFKHGHRITYTFDTLERDVRASGLEILQSGGVFFKPFANFQLDRMLESGIIDDAYLEGCYQLGMQYPDLCACLYMVCGKGDVR